jgi:capsid protein
MMLFRNQNRRMTMQGRGLPIFSASTPEIEDLGDLSNSAIKRAEVTSKIGAIMRTAKPARLAAAMQGKNPDGTPTQGITSEGRSANMGQIPDGSILALPMDDGAIETISHTGNIDLVALMENGVRNYCAGTGIPKEILMSNFSGINFSSGKLSFDKFFRKLGRWEKALSLVLAEIRKAVVTEGLLLQGIVPDASDLVVSGWIGAPRPDPNPQQTANADKQNIENRTDTRTRILAERMGVSYEQMLMILKSERELDAEYGFNQLEQVTNENANA